MEIGERKLQILQAIITDYVKNAEPVLVRLLRDMDWVSARRLSEMKWLTLKSSDI